MSELIELNRIKVYRNYREHDPEDIAALAQDMRVNGYRESYPIELCPDGFGDYLIITGHGRLGHTPYFYVSSVETWQNERKIDTASKV